MVEPEPFPLPNMCQNVPNRSIQGPIGELLIRRGSFLPGSQAAGEAASNEGHEPVRLFLVYGPFPEQIRVSLPPPCTLRCTVPPAKPRRPSLCSRGEHGATCVLLAACGIAPRPQRPAAGSALMPGLRPPPAAGSCRARRPPCGAVGRRDPCGTLGTLRRGLQ